MPEGQNQGPNSPNVAGHGGGVDPCASYTPTVCGSVSSTEKDYAPYFTDPSSLRDSNGCYMFNGCYLKWNNHYYYWTGQTAGYNIVSPQFGGGGGGGTGGGGAGGGKDPNANCVGGEHQFIGSPITYNSQEWAWWSPSIGYLPVGKTPSTYTPVPCGGGGGGGSGGGGGGIDLGPLITIFGWIPGFTQTFNTLLNNLPATLASSLLAGNGPLLDAINKLIAKTGGGGGIDPAQWTNIVTTLSNQLAQNSLDFTKASAEQTQAVVDQLGKTFQEIVGDTALSADKFFHELGWDKLAIPLGADSLLSNFNDLVKKLNGNSQEDWQAIITALFTGQFDAAGKLLEHRLEGYKLVLDYLLSGKFNSWAELEQALQPLAESNKLGFLLLDFMAFVTLIPRLAVTRSQPIIDELQQLSYAEHPTRPLDEGTLLEAFRRDFIDFDNLAENMAKLGIDRDKASLSAALTEQLPTQGILEQSVLRGFMSLDTAKQYLKNQGFSAEVIDAITSLFQHIPSPADLTRIADKRVWSSKTDPKYGQYQELPDEYRDYMAQWGFDPKFTEWLWASHWNLPSPQQTFEMFHRGLISQEDIETYLGLTDWLPFFRDKLLGISYNPLGRIDIKRAHNSGIIDDKTTLQKYKDIGYDEANARILLEISRQSGHDNAEHLLQQITDRTRTAVENAYKKGSITAQEATAHLVSLGIDAPTAAALLAVLDHEIVAQGTLGHREAHQKRAIDAVIRSFSKGSLPYNDAVAYLGDLSVDRYSAIHELMFAEIEREAELKGEWANHAVKLFTEHTIEWPDFVAMLRDKGFSDTEINQLGQEADMKRQQRAKKPTEAQFKSAYKKNIISEAEFANELRGLGYNEKYVAMLIAEA